MKTEDNETSFNSPYGKFVWYETRDKATLPKVQLAKYLSRLEGKDNKIRLLKAANRSIKNCARNYSP